MTATPTEKIDPIKPAMKTIAFRAPESEKQRIDRLAVALGNRENKPVQTSDCIRRVFDRGMRAFEEEFGLVGTVAVPTKGAKEKGA